MSEIPEIDHPQPEDFEELLRRAGRLTTSARHYLKSDDLGLAMRDLQMAQRRIRGVLSVIEPQHQAQLAAKQQAEQKAEEWRRRRAADPEHQRKIAAYLAGSPVSLR